MANPYDYDYYPSIGRFGNMVLMSLILFMLLSFLAVVLPFMVQPETVTISKPIVADGAREAMSFNEMFSRSKYWG